jgi:hypothetical protein
LFRTDRKIATLGYRLRRVQMKREIVSPILRRFLSLGVSLAGVSADRFVF